MSNTPTSRTDTKFIDQPILQQAQATSEVPFRKRAVIMVTIACGLFASALELSAVSTALPTIVESIPGFQPSAFIWVGAAYSLAGTVFLPLSGSLAQVLGRRSIFLVALLFFAVGSAICGAAHNQAMLISGRTIQGVGGGSITCLTNIIMADMIPLPDRGKYNAFLSLAWSLASILGPVVGGGFAQAGAWRWLFYMNIPLCGLIAVAVMLFLKLKVPRESFIAKSQKLDLLGNIIISASTTSCILALSWAGILYPWSSFRVIVPLSVGLVGIIFFFVYEATVAKYPTAPFSLWSNRTGCSGYIQTIISQAALLCLIYYLPAYFQACKLASPLRSGVDMFGLAISIVPFSVIVGITIAKYRCYRPQLWIGWCLTMLSMGLLSTVKAEDTVWKTIGLCILVGAAFACLYSTTMFPILAPLPISLNANAIALIMFTRMFGQGWGIAIGGTVLQNGLRNLPREVLDQLPSQSDIAYSAVAIIRTLPEPARTQAQDAFASAIARIWQTLAGLAGLGFLVSFLMKGVKMHNYTDENWGLEENRRADGKISNPI